MEHFSQVSPLVSVVMPVYNTAEFLQAALDSVLNQTYRNLQLIVADDGSTDGCAEMADPKTGNMNHRTVTMKSEMIATKHETEAVKVETGTIHPETGMICPMTEAANSELAVTDAK